MGGLVGKQQDGSIANSYAIINVSTGFPTQRTPLHPSLAPLRSSEFTGGLVGDQNNSSIINSHAMGHVSGLRYVGGLVGRSEGESSIRYSSARGNVSINNRYTGTSNSRLISRFIGGLVGSKNGGVITNSFATGNVIALSSNSLHTGGLVGYQFGGMITNSFATGSVTGMGSNTGGNVGGLVGRQQDSSIANSYANGDIHGRQGVGGLVDGNKIVVLLIVLLMVG